MLSLDFSISGQNQSSLDLFQMRFKRLGDDIGDMTKYASEFSDWFYQMESAQFQGEGRSNRWPALSAAYEERRSRITPFPFPMQRTGALKASLSRKNAPNAVYEESKDVLTFGTSLPYAKWHMGPSGNRPARKVIDVQEVDKTDAKKRSGKVLRQIVARTVAPQGLVMM